MQCTISKTRILHKTTFNTVAQFLPSAPDNFDGGENVSLFRRHHDSSAESAVEGIHSDDPRLRKNYAGKSESLFGPFIILQTLRFLVFRNV
jgi:hypothetical protein